jgi:two-component system response regulator AgrA
MLHFVILDDDAVHNISTSKKIESIFKEYNIEATIALSTTKPKEVIEYCLNNTNLNNVYLLDVDIQDRINGIDVATDIRQQDANAYIVFISAHPEFVMPSLKTKIFDYLIKPVSMLTMAKCIQSIHTDFMKLHLYRAEQLTIKSGFESYTVDVDEITFFEKYGHLLVAHTVLGKIESSESLESIENRLNKKKFFRCHKSYLVNILHISKIDYTDNMIYLKNGEACQVSKRCKKELKSICGLI